MSINNRQAKSYVANSKEFKTAQGSIFAEWIFPKVGNALYVVYSYGRHWPLFAKVNGQWYANSDKYSVTTSKHYGQAHPGGKVVMLPVEQMRQLVATGEVPK